MEPAVETFDSFLAHKRRTRNRFARAAVVSIAAHLAVVGALWSAQVARVDVIRLGGSDGSTPLIASFERPQPADAVIVERLMSTQVRIEPDHMHVDRQLYTPTPRVDEPAVEKKPTDIAHHHGHEHATNEPHDHAHPLEPHRHEVAKLQSTAAPFASAVPASAASASSAAQAAGNDETLPAVFDNPPPVYPIEAVRARIEGVTTLRIVVQIDGSVASVEVVQSSGHRALDDAAFQAVRRWRFTPGRRGGRIAPFALRLPIEFKL